MTKGQVFSECPYGVIVWTKIPMKNLSNFSSSGKINKVKTFSMPLSYDLTTFQILGQKFVKFFIGILVQTMTPRGHFEIN